MGHNGKRYTEEFKRQLIDLHLAGKSIAVLAEEHGLVEQTIYKCKKLPSLTLATNKKAPNPHIIRASEPFAM